MPSCLDQYKYAHLLFFLFFSLFFRFFFTVKVNYLSFCWWLFYVTIRNKETQFPSSISFHMNQMKDVWVFLYVIEQQFPVRWNWCGDNYTVLLDKRKQTSR